MAVHPHLTPWFVDGFDAENWQLSRIQLNYLNDASQHAGNTGIPGYDGLGRAMQAGSGGTFITNLSRDLDNTKDTWLFNMNVKGTFNADGRFFPDGASYFFSINDGFTGSAFNFPPSKCPLALVFITRPGDGGIPHLELWKNVQSPSYMPILTPSVDYTLLWTGPPMVLDKWYKVQLKFTYSTGYVELWHSEKGQPGQIVFKGSSAFFKPYSRFTFYNGGDIHDQGWCVDDLVVWYSDDGTGVFPSDEIIVKTLFMDRDGANFWTRNTNFYGNNNFHVINENDTLPDGRPISDLANSYVESTAVFQEESYLVNTLTIPNVDAIAINVAWSSTSGSMSIVPLVAGSPVGAAKSLTAGSPTYPNDNGAHLEGWKVDEWIVETPAFANWGVRAMDAGIQMSQFYLEAITLGRRNRNYVSTGHDLQNPGNFVIA